MITVESTLAAAFFFISPESLGPRPRASQPDTQIWKKEAVERKIMIRDGLEYLAGKET